MEKKLYNLNYQDSTDTIEFGEYQVPMPVMPPFEEMENYGLPIEDQKFKRTEIPRSLLNRKNNLSIEESEFVRREFHKRKHGVWYLIKGIPIYFTGAYYTYLHYWWTKNNIHPDFRYVQCLLFLFWDMCKRDTDCYGANLIKPRRIGGTEFTLFLVWEYISRVRNVRGGMQSKNDDTAFVNFKRLTRANKKMIWFMKPISKGSDDPAEILEFRYPIKTNTEKKMREMAQTGEDEENIYGELEMSSSVDYKPCDPLAYDGEEINLYILNESGKLERMSLIDCWDKVKPCLHYFDGAEIVGKAWFESTIEEINDEQIEEINTLWKDSDPNSRDENGRTISGLYRIFINYLDAAIPDEYGFPNKVEAKKFHDNKIDALKKRKKYKEISTLLRKEPEKIEDALTPSGNQSAFNKEQLTDTLKRIDYPEVYGFKEVKWTTRGNFAWAGGQFDTKVVFLPDEQNGKFVVSQLLKDGEDNAQVVVGGIRYPAGVHKYRGGVDPYEHAEVVDKARASKGAGVIGRMYDDNEDGAKMDEGKPIDVAWNWISKQVVCHYCHREEDPEVFFEDMLMMHVYYGTQMNVENNKISIKTHFKKRGYGEYIMPRPEITMAENAKATTVAQGGTPATTDTIQQYFDAIAHYVMVYGNSIKHREIILDLLELNKGNRTKHDLGVAFGWMLIAFEKKYNKVPIGETTEQASDWFAVHRV
jgi:hypothetical protein